MSDQSEPVQPAKHLFASLRLTEEEFARYSRATDITFKRPIGSGSNPIKVVGYGEDATAAIKAANPDGKDYIEVQWGPIDSMLWIMQRLEEQLRIPLKVWRLAGDGMVLDPGLLVGGHSLFRKENIELLLVPGNMMADYLSKNQKEHAWKILTPGISNSTDPMEKAQATFHLLGVKDSLSWEKYFAQRTRADSTIKGILDQYSGEELDPLLEQIRTSFSNVVGDTLIPEEQQHVIVDGLVPFRFETEDGWGDVIDADVMTRIYSPTKPSSVDVYWAYHHRTRWESVEFDCRLMYRVHDPVPSSDLGLPRGGTAPRVGREGWKLFFELGLADLPPGRRWKPIDQMEWGLKEADAKRIHEALFDTEERSPLKTVDKVATMRMLLAAAGIPFGVARTEDGDDGQDPERIATVRWELDHDEWIALNIRKACGVSLQRDANYKPRSADDDDDYPEDSDEDDDEEYDSDEDPNY
ncbi:hypothetical protein BXZ70DRAFT_200352 [Cristinia sonorae]|uniref:Uncharacterized protein n=1 Tax=Cristinia sonorae TaxID=1940300 RepID=A0A8K0UML9_9AGAR|nr:hypothetical protein BXZ70DRAFT_200352 [Cristinia sonorae]